MVQIRELRGRLRGRLRCRGGSGHDADRVGWGGRRFASNTAVSLYVTPSCCVSALCCVWVCARVPHEKRGGSGMSDREWGWIDEARTIAEGTKIKLLHSACRTRSIISYTATSTLLHHQHCTGRHLQRVLVPCTLPLWFPKVLQCQAVYPASLHTHMPYNRMRSQAYDRKQAGVVVAAAAPTTAASRALAFARILHPPKIATHFYSSLSPRSPPFQAATRRA